MAELCFPQDVSRAEPPNHGLDDPIETHTRVSKSRRNLVVIGTRSITPITSFVYQVLAACVTYINKKPNEIPVAGTTLSAADVDIYL